MLTYPRGNTAEFLSTVSRYALIRNTQPSNTPWVRPADWVALPVLGPTDQRFVGLFGVYNAGANFLAVNFTGTGQYVVDWGDGTTPDTVNSGVTAYHNYSYSAAPLVGTEHYDSAGNVVYRQAIVSVTMASGNMTAMNLNVVHNQSGLPSGYSVPWLDIALNGPNITSINIGGTNVKISSLRQAAIGAIGAVTNMTSMFHDCYSLVSVPLFVTSAVTNMTSMFYSCYSLVSVPLFVTSAVTNMTSMFQSCYSLVSVPLFVTSAVTNMSSMFTNCYSLVSVPLFVTSAVTNMSIMFNGCHSLVSVPLFVTSAVTNMTSMFYDCYSLVSVPLFVTSAVTNMTSMFYDCYSLVSVPLFVTSAVTNMTSMFYSCYSLVSVPLFVTSAVTNMTSMFQSCYSLVSVPLFVTSAVTNMSSMFQRCYSLGYIPALNLSSVTAGNLGSAFLNASSIKSAPINPAVSFTLNAMLSSADLDALYTALPVVVGQTLTCSGNYGYAGSTTTIATLKGWTLA